ncbi:alanine aminotransferase 2 [Phytophthora cinnamomi]|uniref:alanine aminotransferase 2 n=1 Tax=Phytophthora cinnamomi TaxID=4785 RepID=UPI00355AB8B5|nr:alanine aminotransferase 2 [Phytophthora cinnamomi]
MLFLPLEEDSWLFRLCLYYGLLVLLLELLVPLVFHRRVHVEIPRLALRGPAAPLSTRDAPKPAPEAASSPLVEQVEGETVEDDEETKESELQEPLTDFQAFCASFATGGSSAAQLVIAKRKHDEAFGREDEQAHGGAAVAQQSFEKRKQPRVQEQEIEQVEDDNVAAVHQSNEKRKHHEAFGSEGEGEDSIDDGVVEQVLEKRTHDEAFGEEERPQEKTPRIARRISFTDEVEALSAHPPKEVPGGHSAAKRKHQQAFGMIDEEDEDAEWRESLAFRPHRSG